MDENVADVLRKSQVSPIRQPSPPKISPAKRLKTKPKKSKQFWVDLAILEEQKVRDNICQVCFEEISNIFPGSKRCIYNCRCGVQICNECFFSWT